MIEEPQAEKELEAKEVLKTKEKSKAEKELTDKDPNTIGARQGSVTTWREDVHDKTATDATSAETSRTLVPWSAGATYVPPAVRPAWDDPTTHGLQD